MANITLTDMANLTASSPPPLSDLPITLAEYNAAPNTTNIMALANTPSKPVTSSSPISNFFRGDPSLPPSLPGQVSHYSASDPSLPSSIPGQVGQNFVKSGGASRQPSPVTDTANDSGGGGGFWGGLGNLFRSINDGMGKLADLDPNRQIRESLGIPDPLKDAPGWLRLLGSTNVSFQGKNGGFSIGKQNNGMDPYTKLAMMKAMMGKSEPKETTVSVGSKTRKAPVVVPPASSGVSTFGTDLPPLTLVEPKPVAPPAPANPFSGPAPSFRLR